MRPVSEKQALATIESSEVEESGEEDLVEASAKKVVRRGEKEKAEEQESEEGEETGREDEEQEVEEEKEDEEKEDVKARTGKKRDVEMSIPVANGAPKSVAARLAARRQAGQKVQRSSANLVMAENYGYVRKDLLLILILAVIMFSVIVVLHFVLGG